MWHRDFYANGAKKTIFFRSAKNYVEPQYSHFVCFTLCELLARICHILVCVKYTYDQLWDFNRYEFSQMPNFRCMKNLHVFVISVKNVFEFFTCVTNTCEFFTHVTASFECESQTNLSHVWKIWTYLSHMWRICESFSQMWQIRVNPRLCEGLARFFQMWQIRANPSLLWKTQTNLSHL